MTRAPRSLRIVVPNGPLSTWVRSTTSNPEKGPATRWGSCGGIGISSFKSSASDARFTVCWPLGFKSKGFDGADRCLPVQHPRHVARAFGLHLVQRFLGIEGGMRREDDVVAPQQL